MYAKRQKRCYILFPRYLTMYKSSLNHVQKFPLSCTKVPSNHVQKFPYHVQKFPPVSVHNVWYRVQKFPLTGVSLRRYPCTKVPRLRRVSSARSSLNKTGKQGNCPTIAKIRITYVLVFGHLLPCIPGVLRSPHISPG